MPGQLKAISEGEMKGTTLSHDAVGPGVYDAQLRGMNEGPTTTRPSGSVSPVHEIPLSPSTEP